ncbi:MAG: cytoskeletal protein binding protein [Cirrosporium novae-zelandiae]|nr:MAG: cytoskeletal protein binding protein [Cirrosporium novae-zelandiae]
MDFADTTTSIGHVESQAIVSERDFRDPSNSPSEDEHLIDPISKNIEKRIRRKVDLRLCTIAGILCSLDLLDSLVIYFTSVTSMLTNLDLLVGNRYSISIIIFTIASVAFQLPSTLAVRFFGPRLFFPFITFTFGTLTFCTAFIQSWRAMIGLRVLLDITMSGIYPGLTYLVSTLYTRDEQQLCFAFMQSSQTVILATGGIVNYGLNHLNGWGDLQGIITYWWIVDFPENENRSFWFLTDQERKIAVTRIQDDRADNLVTVSLSYFLPIILQGGMGFSPNQAIFLSTPPHYFAVIPALISSRLGDKYWQRGLIISFNATCLIVGFCMLGFCSSDGLRYAGTFLATGAYVSNWAAFNAYIANNVVGQYHRAVTACNGLGGVAGSFIVRQVEAPKYITAI